VPNFASEKKANLFGSHFQGAPILGTSAGKSQGATLLSLDENKLFGVGPVAKRQEAVEEVNISEIAKPKIASLST